ncbi:endoplasmic reticulum vesicle transporter-domain-containing protein [Mycena amicta]|nr:endoplasmic reticulum vesicle transporter-domain-containing protein [Mycena amicta]KAJ7052128.1 endoplasmic reticulum vesicle transporter-domain-containing protein [Mycena amicta]
MSLDGETAAISVLEKLDAAVPAPLAQFDAFPKLPSTYKARSDSRGFLTVFVALVTFVLMLNDVGEFLFGWPDHEFSVDSERASFMNVNVDMVVAMPCSFISVDLRDAVGDRLFLSHARSGIRRDGVKFDVGQATKLKAHSDALSVRQAVAQSRKSRGLLAGLFQWDSTPHMPSYKHEPDARACRISGQLEIKKVTANLHITTLGHGYSSNQHVDHTLMNLSHVITEFSFGPFFPEIVQPLDNSFEVTQEHFVAYQYFLHVVPTTYIAPRSNPLRTHQYSVTHYTRVMDHHSGTPGIFFKFDLDPMSITIHQRTTTFLQLIIRCVGVIGGVFTCMGYAIKIGTAAVEAVTGDSEADITPAAVSSASSLRNKFTGSSLRSRPKSGRLVPQGNGWVMEGTPGSPGYGSAQGTPVSASFSLPPASPYAQSPNGPYSPALQSPYSPALQSPYSQMPPSQPGTPGVGMGFGPNPLSAGPPRRTHSGTPNVGSPRPLSVSSPNFPGVGSVPGTPSYGVFPPTPGPASGFSVPQGPPPQGKRMSVNGNGSPGPGGKKEKDD